jgi:hypothetical protein
VDKVLCYKPEGRGFDTPWGEWIFSICLIFPAALGPMVVYSASNRNEFQKWKNVDCLDNVGSLTSHKPIGCLLREKALGFTLEILEL